MEFDYRRRFAYWIGCKYEIVGRFDKLLITVENDWSQVFYVKDFNELSGRNVLHLVDVETGEECLIWAERITSIKKVEEVAL
jgi:hypothetical protein